VSSKDKKSVAKIKTSLPAKMKSVLSKDEKSHPYYYSVFLLFCAKSKSASPKQKLSPVCGWEKVLCFGEALLDFAQNSRKILYLLLVLLVCSQPLHNHCTVATLSGRFFCGVLYVSYYVFMSSYTVVAFPPLHFSSPSSGCHAPPCHGPWLDRQ
jgi:hypothetical protein